MIELKISIKRHRSFSSYFTCNFFFVLLWFLNLSSVIVAWRAKAYQESISQSLHTLCRKHDKTPKNRRKVSFEIEWMNFYRRSFKMPKTLSLNRFTSDVISDLLPHNSREKRNMKSNSLFLFVFSSNESNEKKIYYEFGISIDYVCTR